MQCFLLAGIHSRKKNEQTNSELLKAKARCAARIASLSRKAIFNFTYSKSVEIGENVKCEEHDLHRRNIDPIAHKQTHTHTVVGGKVEFAFERTNQLD